MFRCQHQHTNTYIITHKIHNNTYIHKINKTHTHHTSKSRRVKANFCAGSLCPSKGISIHIFSALCFAYTAVVFWETHFSLPEHFAMPLPFSMCFDLGSTQKRFEVEWESKDGPRVTHLNLPLEKSSNKQMPPVDKIATRATGKLASPANCSVS